MPITTEHLDKVRRLLDRSVSFTHLARLDWRRQTDAIREAFILARLFADLGKSAVFVDGHIGDQIKRRALEEPSGVKGYFNRRFHDIGLKSRRFIAFDTFTTRKMGERGSGRAKLHFHAALELPRGWSKADLQRELEKVFGRASPMGRRQFHISEPNWDRHHTHNGVQVSGPLGKLVYVLAHAGATYRALDLNEDGKRSRRAPRSRGSCNREAKGLARGIPSNFNSQAVLCDNASKRAGKEAFDAWIKAERAQRPPLEEPRERGAPVPKQRAAG